MAPLEPSHLHGLAYYASQDEFLQAQWSNMTELAANLSNTPSAWLLFSDGSNDWVRGSHGTAEGDIEIHRSLFRQTAEANELTIFSNTQLRPGKPSESGLRHYLGTPLCAGGEMVGVLCVADVAAREILPSQRLALQSLARQAVALLEQSRRIDELELRHAAEAQASASGARLLEIVSRMSEACFALDREWRFTFVNARCETLLHRKREEMLGKSIWEVFDPLVGTAMEQEYRRAMSERIPVRFEPFSPIAQRWLDIRLIPTDEGLGAFLLDIHERKTLEVEREKFVSLADNSREFIGMCDLNGVPFYANEAAARLIGADSPATAISTPVADFFFPEDRPFIEKEFFPKVLREGHAETEIRFRHFKTGDPLWMLYHVFAIRDASGQPLGYATVSRDITDRKRVEEALRIREEHARSLLHFSQQLERTATIPEVLRATRDAIQRTLGIGIAWFYLLSDDGSTLQLVISDEAEPRTEHQDGKTLPIAGDAMLEELVRADHLVLVEDAATDPRTNKQIVARLQNRTILNMPIRLAGRTLGVVGTGTFGDDGIRHFTPAEREYFSSLASRAAAALDRVFALEKRQRVEEQLRESGAFTDDILDSLTANIAVLDSNGTIVRVNSAWEKFARENSPETSPPMQFVGSNYFASYLEAPGGDDTAECIAGIRSVLAGTRATFTFEYACHSPTQERWFFMRASRLHGPQAGAVVAHEDITERKLAERAHLISEERLQTVIRHMSEGLVLARLDGQLVHWNPAALEMHGFDHSEDWHRMLPEFATIFELRTIDRKAIALPDWPMSRVARGEKIRDLEVRVRRLGTDWERVFRYNGDIVQDPNGEKFVFVTISDITARQLAEEKLRSSQKDNHDLRAALDEHAIVAMTDPQGRITFVNDKFCSISKYSREELLGRDHRLINSKFHSKDFMRKLWTTIRSGKVWHGEIKNRAKDGSHYWVDTTIVPFLNQSGEVRQYVAIRADITERKKAEEDLEGSRRFLSEVIEKSGSLIFVKDQKGRYQLVNRKWEEVTGVPRSKVLGLTDAEVFPPEDARRFREADRAIMESGVGQTTEEFLTDGERTRSFLSVKFPMRDADGGVSGICGMTAEITERKEAEEKLREQATLLDKAQDAIIVRSLDQDVTFWNKSAERLYGWTTEEAMGQPVERLIYRDPAAFRDATEVVFSKGEWIGEIEQYTKDGDALVIQGRWTLVRDDEGQPKSILCINTDLTERKKLEQQFLRAQRMESIGTLAGGIAHDLNNVLGPILMALELLKLRFPDRQSLELISILAASAERGAAMVKQVLSFARGVAGDRLEVQVRHLVNDIAKILNETFLKHLEVRVSIPHDLWTVIGDATQLHQVLLNLCVNARDAMPQGGILHISAENVAIDAHYAGLNPEASPGPYVILEVEDNGTGIPADVLQKIFDPFFTTKELGKGTGLGLSTTMAIVKSHGGFIRVYSEVGRGTTFRVYLPATESTETSDTTREAELPRGNGECILVVDDEASVRQITQQTMEAFGYRVMLACDGAEALSIFAVRQAEITAVLTDMMMPVMDGPALIQVLRKMKPAMPILAASGLAAEAQVTRATSLGVKHFLPKPYTAETLLKSLKQALSSAGN